MKWCSASWVCSDFVESIWDLVRESAVKPVGKPDAGNRHVRFDERGRETGRRFGVSARARPRLYQLSGCDDVAQALLPAGVPHGPGTLQEPRRKPLETKNQPRRGFWRQKTFPAGIAPRSCRRFGYDTLSRPRQRVQMSLRTPDPVEFRMTQVCIPAGDGCPGRWFRWQ